MDNEQLSRFIGAEWFDTITDQNIMILGCGGIGSWTALFISRLNPRRVTLVDPDTVELANLSGQCFSINSVESSKVSALKEVIHYLSDYILINSFKTKIGEGDPVLPITICGFDNMKARKIAFESWKSSIKNQKKEECLFIDGRLNAEMFQIFCISGNDTAAMEKYEKEWLFPDEEAEKAVCSYKQTSYCAAMIGSYITNLLVNWATNKTKDTLVRILPFKIEYDAEMMNLKIEN